MTSPSKTPPLVVVSGASGSGKTTICRKIADEFGFYYSVSHTTRSQRDREQHGVDYFFAKVSEFLSMIDAGDFLEWAKVYGNYYGTSKRIIEERLKAGQGVILDVDTQGASSIKTLFPSALLVFLMTPSVEDLHERLKSRGTDSHEEIGRRVAHAENEIAQAARYDRVVMNNDLDAAVAEVRDLLHKHGVTKS